jgi:pSer/pThr/pTyr-binding forkhead associated (FHA) protein
MKLKNLFSKSKAPQKKGDLGHAGTELAYFIQFSNLDHQPIYELKSSLCVGSKTGDIVFDDPSLSPKHCTFFINQGVVSVMDHKSEEGTFVSEHQIPAGKMFILGDKDFVRMGELEADIIAQEIEVPANLEVHAEEESGQAVEENSEELSLSNPDSTAEVNIDDLSMNVPVAKEVINEDSTQEIATVDLLADDDSGNQDDLSVFDESEQEAEKVKKPSLFSRIFKKKKTSIEEEPVNAKPSFSIKLKGNKKNKIKASVVDHGYRGSANAFSRILAILADGLIAYSLFIIMENEDYYWSNTQLISDFIKDNYLLHLNPIIGQQLNQFPIIAKSALKAYSTIDLYIGVFYLYLVLRLSSTLLLGVSLGQSLMGIRAYGNAIWSRLGGVLRIIFSIALLPLSLFDFMILFGKRSAKEVLSFTRVQINSKVRLFSGIFVMFPLVICFFLLSPLFKGFELKKTYIVKQDNKKTKKIAVETNNETPRYYSNQMSFMLETTDITKYSVFPFFEIKGKSEKKFVVSKTAFYNPKLKSYFVFNLFKNFKLVNFLQMAVQSDPLIDKNFPTLKKIATQAANNNKNFSNVKLSKVQEVSFYKEFEEYIQAAFALGLESIVGHVEKYGPFFKGYIDIREKIEVDANLPSINDIQIKKIGNNRFIVLTFKPLQKTIAPIITYIPITQDHGLVFNLEIEEFKDSKVFEKDILSKMTFLKEKRNLVDLNLKKFLHAFEVHDYFLPKTSSADQINKVLQLNHNLYYQFAKDALQNAQSEFLKYLLMKMNNSVQSLNLLAKKERNSLKKKAKKQKKKGEPVPEVFKTKYDDAIKNFNSIIEAIKNNDQNYFGINIKS